MLAAPHRIASQSQDLSIIDDLVTGLKALLYLVYGICLPSECGYMEYASRPNAGIWYMPPVRMRVYGKAGV
jgi:hypothetical protein